MSDVLVNRITRHESYLSDKIEMVRINDRDKSETLLGIGTYFLWERDNKWYAVTNNHNLSGWDHLRCKSISANGSQPTHVHVNIKTKIIEKNTNKLNIYSSKILIQLYESDCPKWFVHPDHGPTVDVGIIEIFPRPNEGYFKSQGMDGIVSTPVNRHSWIDYSYLVGDDAYVLGFPRGMDALGFPVWKKATIASEPYLDIEGLPKILIDTATREGMSGSPVISMRRGLITPSGKIGNDSYFGEAMNLIGIYSGRIGDDPLGAQLGVVWKARVIDEIIDGRFYARLPWDVV